MARLEALERQTGRSLLSSARPDLAVWLSREWRLFWTLSRSRRQGFSEPERIAPADAEALLRLEGEPAEEWPWLWRVLNELDAAWIGHWRGTQRRTSKTPK